MIGSSRYPLVLAVTLALAACSPAPSSNQAAEASNPPAGDQHLIAPTARRPVQKVDGLQLPGMAMDARSAGFTECGTDQIFMHDVFVCRQPEPRAIFGAHATGVRVIFDGQDHFAADAATAMPRADIKSADPASLSYDTVAFEVEPNRYDDACLAKHRGKAEGWAAAVAPDDCAIDGGIATFREGLLAAGWIEVSDRRYSDFQKRGVPVRISVHPARADGHAVTITSVEQQSVDESFARYDEKRAARQQDVDAERNFADAMKPADN